MRSREVSEQEVQDLWKDMRTHSGMTRFQIQLAEVRGFKQVRVMHGIVKGIPPPCRGWLPVEEPTLDELHQYWSGLRDERICFLKNLKAAVCVTAQGDRVNDTSHGFVECADVTQRSMALVLTMHPFYQVEDGTEAG